MLPTSSFLATWQNYFDLPWMAHFWSYSIPFLSHYSQHLLLSIVALFWSTFRISPKLYSCHICSNLQYSHRVAPEIKSWRQVMGLLLCICATSNLNSYTFMIKDGMKIMICLSCEVLSEYVSCQKGLEFEVWAICLSPSVDITDNGSLTTHLHRCH